jgi:hypothetical protein
MTSFRRLRLVAACALSLVTFAFTPAIADQPLKASAIALRDSRPQILAMQISDVDLHVGERVQGHVETSPDVTAVDIHVGYWRMPLSRTRTGRFDGEGKIPFIAFFFKGKYTLRVIAHSADGKTTERDLAIQLR